MESCGIFPILRTQCGTQIFAGVYCGEFILFLHDVQDWNVTASRVNMNIFKFNY